MIRAPFWLAALPAAGVAHAQDVTPSTPPVDSPYGSTSAPETSSGGTRRAVLSSPGDPNPTTQGDGHALSEAVTAGASNRTPTPGAAPTRSSRPPRSRMKRRPPPPPPG